MKANKATATNKNAINAKIAKAVKSAKNKLATAEVVTAEVATKAIKIELDRSSRHTDRVKAQALGVDLFALHGVYEWSKGYLLTMVGKVDAIRKATAGKAISHVLIVGAVGNSIIVGNDGDYSRDAGEGGQLVGNVEALKSLYGARAQVLTLAEFASRADKGETVTVRVGRGKAYTRTHTGVIVASDADRSVMAVKQNSGKWAVVNLEFTRNDRNFAEQASVVKNGAATK